MVNYKYKRSPVDHKVKRKSKTLPNQSLSIKDIVERFVRGLPVDVSIKQPVYLDQHDHDFNKLASLDRVDKAYEATELREKAEQLGRQVQANEQAAREKQAKDLEDQKARHERNTGIGNLDNTMPDDTGTDSQSVSRGRKNK